MKKKYKSTLIIIGTVLLILINFLCFWIGYHNFLYPKLGEFEIKKINHEKEQIEVQVTPCHNAISYTLQIREEGELIYEAKSEDETILLTDFQADYNDSLDIVVIAKNKNGEIQENKNRLSYIYQDASFDKYKNHLLSGTRDLTLLVLGYDSHESYTLELFYEKTKLYSEKINSPDVYIPYEVVDGYSGRVTAILKNQYGRNISSFNFYLNTPIVGKIDIVSPSDEFTTRWDDITISIKGGENANHYYARLYSTGGLQDRLELERKENRLVIPAEHFLEENDYMIVIEAVYDDFFEIAEEDTVSVHIAKKEATQGVYVSHNPTFIKSGTKVSLRTITKDAVIHYTLDGSVPTKESLIYTNPIVITEDTTIKTYAESSNRYDSVLATFDFKVEERTPIIYLSPSNQDENYGVKEVFYTTEMEIMNRVADVIEEELKNAGFTVYRNTPSGDINLWSSISRSVGADFHFAIHSNASRNHTARGPEIHVDNEYSLSYSIASNIYENLWKIYDGNTNYNYHRGVKYTRGSLGEANDSYLKCSSLIEVAFHDNYEDASWVMNNITNIGKNIASSIISYYN